METTILIVGACGQIGSELTLALRKKYGSHAVIASDIREGNTALMTSGPFEILDAGNKEALKKCIEKYRITDVYLMAALLSATSEQFPQKAWDLNMNSLSHVLDFGRDKLIKKIFWPSSIAVFGPTTPKNNTPQVTITEPSSVYGITKLAGERWCEYFYNKYNVDVRSLRYPGLISWKTPPGGGTTDYAVSIFHEAISKGSYECFLKDDTILPMMYMDDAITATIALMEADSSHITVRSSYNIAGISFSPKEIAAAIKNYIPDFSITYKPDFRQLIADSWPASINDAQARNDWGWKHKFDLNKMTQVMIDHLQEVYKK